MNKTKVTYMDADSLIPYANNPRLNDNAVDAVAASIKEFGFKVPMLEEDEPQADDTYTRKVNIPQYEPTGECPSIDELVDDSKANELVMRIQGSNVTPEEREFLIKAATRHYAFNYKKVAEYYANATPEMQELMEDSALVIIDVDDAIAKGYAKLAEDIEFISGEDDA